MCVCVQAEAIADEVRYLIWITGGNYPNTLRVALILDGEIGRRKSARRAVEVRPTRFH